MSNNQKTLDPQEVNNTLQNIADKSGIKKWDLGASTSKDISAQIDNGEAKQLKASQRSSITLRVWNSDNQVGITSTSDITYQGLKLALSKAKEACKYGNSEETPEFSSLSKSELPDLYSPLIEFWGIKRLVQELKLAEEKLINTHKAIKSVPYNGFSETYYERIYLNSEGALRESQNTQSSLYLFAKAQEDGRKPRSSGAIRIANGSNEIDIENCVEEAAHNTIEHLDYFPIKTGKYLICFKPEPFLDLINAFSNIFNARSILDGVSLSNKDSIGTKIASEILNIEDNGLHQGNVGAGTFDGEGTPTKSISLLRAGVIDNFIHSEATARKFGVKPTGHAGIGAKVSVSPDFFVISKNTDVSNKFSDLSVKTYKDDFVLVDNLHALHAGIKSSQGSFSLPFDGWLYEKGSRKSIESATIAGDILKLLSSIICVEQNQIITHQGVSPYIWIDELAVTGDK